MGSRKQWAWGGRTERTEGLPCPTRGPSARAGEGLRPPFGSPVSQRCHSRLLGYRNTEGGPRLCRVQGDAQPPIYLPTFKKKKKILLKSKINTGVVPLNNLVPFNPPIKTVRLSRWLLPIFPLQVAICRCFLPLTLEKCPGSFTAHWTPA